MAIQLYQNADNNSVIGTDSTDALYVGHNKRSTLEKVTPFFLKNEDTSKWYSNVEISFTSTGEEYYSGTNGFSAKMYYGELEPNSKVWERITAGDKLSIGRLGSPSGADTSFKKVWIKTSNSNYAEVGLYDIDLSISYAEHTI